jgi:hypothetical protein
MGVSNEESPLIAPLTSQVVMPLASAFPDRSPNPSSYAEPAAHPLVMLEASAVQALRTPQPSA